MSVTATLKSLDFSQALKLIDDGAVFVDLRPTDDYLEVHVPGSLDIVYEAGPGMAMRARDCIPLDIPLVVIEDPASDALHAAASLKGKGFVVAGKVTDAVNQWVANGGQPASTEIVAGGDPPDGTILDVADPGARITEAVHSTRIPADVLWHRAHDLAGDKRIVVGAGYGVRAGLAVGMLERVEVREIVFWKTRP